MFIIRGVIKCSKVPTPFVAKDKPEQTLIIGKALPRTHGNIVKLVFITFI